MPVGAVLQRAEGVTEVQHVLSSSKENEFPIVDTHGESNKSHFYQDLCKFDLCKNDGHSKIQGRMRTAERPEETADS